MTTKRRAPRELVADMGNPISGTNGSRRKRRGRLLSTRQLASLLKVPCEEILRDARAGFLPAFRVRRNFVFDILEVETALSAIAAGLPSATERFPAT